jgi:hypothetical protein
MYKLNILWFVVLQLEGLPNTEKNIIIETDKTFSSKTQKVARLTASHGFNYKQLLTKTSESVKIYVFKR